MCCRRCEENVCNYRRHPFREHSNGRTFIVLRFQHVYRYQPPLMDPSLSPFGNQFAFERQLMSDLGLSHDKMGHKEYSISDTYANFRSSSLFLCVSSPSSPNFSPYSRAPQKCSTSKLSQPERPSSSRFSRTDESIDLHHLFTFTREI